MFFNSFAFGFFLVACLGLHALLPRRWRNVFLLLCSYVFYGAWNWRFLGLLWLSTVVDYSVGLAIEGASGPRAASRRRGLLLVSVFVNLGILGIFKYAGFFAESFAVLLGHLGIEVAPFVLDVVLPVGISFYTFQTLGYTVDVYRREIQATRRLVDFALYVAFFPQLVAGPIERAKRFLPQIAAERRVTAAAVRSGLWLILWGTFKKVVVADNLAGMVDAVHAVDATPSGAEVLLAIYGFAFQIYCDFSGYTDVARGVARLLGFELMLNFRRPYFATSPPDLWRRWHISLSSWLRDYLYIPLGGNRRGPLRNLWNLAITMILGGLWHGAAWTYVVWGAFHGLWLVVHRVLRVPLAALAPEGALLARCWRGACMAVTFHLWCLGMLVFRSENLPRAGELLRTLAGGLDPGLAPRWLGPFLFLIAPVVVMQLWQAARDDDEPVPKAPLVLRATLYVAAFLAIVFLGEDHGQPFIYFQF